MLMMNVQGRNM